MSYGLGNGFAPRYVPHTEVTKAHYERLLQDVSRCAPPGVEDLEDIADQVLSIVCGAANDAASSANADASVGQQQALLERLLDKKLNRDMRDRLVSYGKLINDYVVTSASGTTAGDPSSGYGVGDLNFAGPSSGSSSNSEASDEDNEDRAMALLTGQESATASARRKKSAKKSLKADKSLMQYAFMGEEGVGGEDGEGGAGVGAARGFVPGRTAVEDDELGFVAEAAPAPITFDEVACNPHHVKDCVRRLFPSHDADTCEALTQRVIDFMSQQSEDDFTLETQLTTCLGGYDDDAVMNWIGDLVASRWGVVYGLRYALCATQKEKTAVMDAMREHGLHDEKVERLYEQITGKEVDPLRLAKRNEEGGKDEDGDDDGNGGLGGALKQPPLRKVDLQACAFKDERAPHEHVRATVPQGTQRLSYDTHDEVILPASSLYNAGEDLIEVRTGFPSWAVPAFPRVEKLNPMQSKVFACAFQSDENMLVSAPTGAGKTNVAMMAMLRAIEGARNSETGSINGKSLKMVYVAPMKALVQEVVRTFTQRLAPLGLTVAELSGDSSMTQQQMADTQLIVTTPEKWDIVTRKSVELGVASLLKLLIIDEVHLLHNERGPVLEAIVSRTMLQQRLRGAGGIRLVGLSATLPNFNDVATFLQVDRQRGLFVFDSTFRPIPLEQTYCAIKKTRGVNQATLMNTVAYDKVLQTVQANEQAMIFVHSRRETEYTAVYLQQRAAAENRGYHFVRPDSDSDRALQEACTGPDGAGLRRCLHQLLPSGFAIHHAGLSRQERNTVEDLFAAGHVKVLVCTSTLAWGVNLPANRVIIKGTRVFNGAKGESDLLSALDVLQMFGRAGRIGFGVSVGRAAIITTPEDLHYYLCVLNQQLPIESQTMKKVVDMLNAEVVLGHVETVEEGVRWLQQTYLYVRMRQVPEVYGIRATASDPLLLHHLANVVHTACEELKAAKMVDYDPQSRRIASTPYGRIAAYCYVTTTSMTSYLSQLSNAMQDAELFRVFASSSEFHHITVRAEEQVQLKELLESAPIAVRESRYTPSAKINVLLQCYISQKDLEGLPLMSEMVYVKDSAQRILRALYEICIVREYGRTARQFLELYLMTLHRQWTVQSPLRQVREVLSSKDYEAILQSLERVRMPWEEMRKWEVVDLADRMRDDRRATAAHRAMGCVPHYIVEAAVRPLTRAMLYVDVDITPDFTFVEAVHGANGNSVRDVALLIEHTSGRLLHQESILLPLPCVQRGETYACPPIVVPMVDPRPTHLYVRLVSSHWLAANATAPVCLLNTLLPPVAPALREAHQRPAVDDGNYHNVAERLAPYHLDAAAENIFPFAEFNPMQADLVEPIFRDSGSGNAESLLVGVPPGGGKTTMAELFVLQFLLEQALQEEDNGGAKSTTRPQRKLLYLTCNSEVARRRALDWKYKFGEVLKQRVVEVTPELAATSGAGLHEELAGAAILVATGASMVGLLRRGDPLFRDVTHIIADHVHLLRAPEGQPMEECLARLNAAPYLTRNGSGRARLLALTYPLISCSEVGRWLKIKAVQQFNFGLSYRQLRVRLASMELPGPRSRYEAGVVAALKLLRTPAYAAAPAVVFVPTARDAVEVAQRALLRCRDGYIPEADAVLPDVEEARLALFMGAGVAYLHRGTSALDLLTILDQMERPVVHPTTQAPMPLLLICSFDAAWRLPSASLVNGIVTTAEHLTTLDEAEGGQEKDGAATTAAAGKSGSTLTYTDCTASELLQMTSRAMNECVVHCRAARRWVWAKLLNEPLPLESSLRYPDDFRDTVNAAIAQRRATSRADVLQVLSSHYFLYHLKSNLHFYGVPSAEDIPLYASTVAAHVVSSLLELGCVEEPAAAQRRARRADPHANEEADEDDDDEEDPHALLVPTVRGMALNHHCLSLRTLEALMATLPTSLAGPGKATAVNNPTFVWKTVAACCVELTAGPAGPAARISEAAEYAALHTIARALPPSAGVRYVDLDFTQQSTKVFLLMLAYCCRLLPTWLRPQCGYASQEGGASVAGLEPAARPSGETGEHLFFHAETDVENRRLLCAIPPPIAHRLAEDAMALLPTVQHVVAAVAEVVDGATQVWAMTHLMRLTACLHQQVWIDEPPMAQLPVVQQRLPAALRPRASPSFAAQCSLDHLHGTPALKEAASLLCAAMKNTVRGGTEEEAVLQQRAAATMAVMVQEAHQVPTVVAIRAAGGAEDMNGTLIMKIHVTATLRWAAAAASRPPSASSWWLQCLLQPSADTQADSNKAVLHTRQLAMRVVQAKPSHDAADALEKEKIKKGDSAAAGHETEERYVVEGELFYPLSALDGDDLEKVELRAMVTSMFYVGVEKSTEVVFEN